MSLRLLVLFKYFRTTSAKLCKNNNTWVLDRTCPKMSLTRPCWTVRSTAAGTPAAALAARSPAWAPPGWWSPFPRRGHGGDASRRCPALGSSLRPFSRCPVASRAHELHQLPSVTLKRFLRIEWTIKLALGAGDIQMWRVLSIQFISTGLSGSDYFKYKYACLRPER